MVAAHQDLIIEQGEDWTLQARFLDDFDNARPLVAPARMDIVDNTGSVMHSLFTNLDPEPGTIPGLVISPDIGLIQMHIPASVTNSFPPGAYKYDLFITTDDEDEYAGTQVGRVLEGAITVRKRITGGF